MRKTIALIMTAVLSTSILLTGCGEKKVEDTPKETVKKQKKVLKQKKRKLIH